MARLAHDSKCSVYIAYGRNRSDVLYVGITNSTGRRMARHAEAAEWWDEVRTIDVEHYSTREMARGREGESCCSSRRCSHGSTLRTRMRARHLCLSRTPPAAPRRSACEIRDRVRVTVPRGSSHDPAERTLRR